MKKYGLLVVSAFLVYSAGTWAYIFFIILREGSIRLGESIRPILMAEVVMATVWTLVGVFFFVVAALALLKRTQAGKVNG